MDQEIQREFFDDGGEEGPPRAAILELAQSGAVVLQQFDVDVAREILEFDVRQVSPPARNTNKLLNQFEVVRKQPLMFHIVSGEGARFRLSVRFNAKHKHPHVVAPYFMKGRRP